MREFTCNYTGCPETDYHRHCVRCGAVVHGRRKKDLLCGQKCRDLDKAWSRREATAECMVRVKGDKQTHRAHLPRRLLPWVK